RPQAHNEKRRRLEPRMGGRSPRPANERRVVPDVGVGGQGSPAGVEAPRDGTLDLSRVAVGVDCLPKEQGERRRPAGGRAVDRQANTPVSVLQRREPPGGAVGIFATTGGLLGEREPDGWFGGGGSVDIVPARITPSEQRFKRRQGNSGWHKGSGWAHPGAIKGRGDC